MRNEENIYTPIEIANNTDWLIIRNTKYISDRDRENDSTTFWNLAAASGKVLSCGIGTSSESGR